MMCIHIQYVALVLFEEKQRNGVYCMFSSPNCSETVLIETHWIGGVYHLIEPTRPGIESIAQKQLKYDIYGF